MKDFLFILPKYDMSRIMSVLPEEVSAKPLNLQVYPFLGVYYLAHIMREQGFNVDVLDITAKNLDLDQALEMVKEISPKLIGIYTSSFSLHYNRILIKNIKKYADIPIILGGPHITGDPSALITLNADYALSGEAMHTLPLLSRNLLSAMPLENVDNLYQNISGVLKAPKKFSPLSPVECYDSYAYDMISSRCYSNPFTELKATSIMTSFGCPFNCIFCMTDSQLRYRSIESVVSELKFLVSKGYNYFSFQDDTLTMNRERVLELCAKIKEEKIKIEWECTTRADCVDRELFQKIYSSGCTMVSLAVETANPKLRNSIIKKAMSDEDIHLAVKTLKDIGFKVCLFFMSGIPKEQIEDLKENKKFIKLLKPDFVDCYIAVALPSTELFRMGVLDKVFAAEIWTEVIENNQIMPVYINPGLSIEKLRKNQKEILRFFYFSPMNILKKIWECRKLSEFINNFKSAIKLLGYLFRS